MEWGSSNAGFSSSVGKGGIGGCGTYVKKEKVSWQEFSANWKRKDS